VNAGEWLAARTPAPEPLAAQVRSLLDGMPAAPGEPVHEALALVAEQRLSELLARGDHSRAIAADLLAIDALVTYACEAAAEAMDTQELAGWSEGFAQRIAALGGGSAGVASAAESEAGS